MSIIPARGGSKGLPGKNIKLLCGKPLIAYTIEASLKCPQISRTVVSTDSPKIAQTAREYGAEVPFLRPSELAADETPSIDVVLHCLDFLKESEGYTPEFVCLLQCTSPLRNERHITEAVRLLEQTSAKSVISVYKADKSPYWAKTVNDKGFLEDLIKRDADATRRQDLPDAYNLNGAVYINETELIYKTKKLVSGESFPYVMDKAHSYDIDDAADFDICEYIMKKYNQEE